MELNDIIVEGKLNLLKCFQQIKWVFSMVSFEEWIEKKNINNNENKNTFLQPDYDL